MAADPFSIAGSAVGVISLSITICQGLISYIDTAKDAEARTSQISARLDSLADELERLQGVVNALRSSPCASSLGSVIMACATAIENIRKKLGKLSTPHGGATPIRERFRDIKRRLLYPFKQEDIIYWKDVLRDVQQDLQTALLTLSLCVILY
jgi:hypothetical protein